MAASANTRVQQIHVYADVTPVSGGMTTVAAAVAMAASIAISLYLRGRPRLSGVCDVMVGVGMLYLMGVDVCVDATASACW